jgi:hypothetical protein
VHGSVGSEGGECNGAQCHAEMSEGWALVGCARHVISLVSLLLLVVVVLSAEVCLARVCAGPAPSERMERPPPRPRARAFVASSLVQAVTVSRWPHPTQENARPSN